MIPEGFVPWLEEFCKDHVMVRVVLHYPSPDRNVPEMRIAEAVTQVQHDWIWCSVREFHHRERPGVSVWPITVECCTSVEPQCKFLPILREPFRDDLYYVPRQIVAMDRRGDHFVRVPAMHPRIIGCLGELYGALWGATGNIQPPGVELYTLRNRLHGLTTDVHERIEKVFPLTAEDD